MWLVVGLVAAVSLGFVRGQAGGVLWRGTGRGTRRGAGSVARGGTGGSCFTGVSQGDS